MRLQRTPLSRNVVLGLLQACTTKKDLAGGRQVYSLMVCSGLDSVAFLADYLIRLFTICGSLLEANQVFAKIPKPSVYSWNAIIAAHAKLGDCEQALQLYCDMHQNGIKPDKFTFLCTLNACSIIQDLLQCRLMHDEVIKCGLGLDIVIKNTLIDMYAKCGSLEEASNVLVKTPHRDVVSWGALITGYVTFGDSFHALELFDKMQEEGMKSHKVIFSCILKACGSLGDAGKGRRIHDCIIRSGLESDVIIGSSLVDMYAKCGTLEEAHTLFDKLENRDVVSWAIIIAGYSASGDGLAALKLFGKMQQNGIKPDKFILSCILKACGSIGSVQYGRLIHDMIIRSGLGLDVVVGSAIVDMYVKCERLEEASEVFDKLPNRNVVSWGTMIFGYTQEGHDLYALELFGKMKTEGISPDNIIISCILRVCGRNGATRLGKLIHDQVFSHGFELDVAVGKAIVYMYANWGNIEQASKVFHKLANRDLESWSTMIAACVQHGYCHLALELFEMMHQSHLVPDTIMFLCILKACASIAALEEGKQIHGQIIRSGLEIDIVVGSTIVDMYTKCESLEDAREVFDNLPYADVVACGAMIAGYAQQGHAIAALELFQQMQDDGIRPDRFIYLCILKACGHTGSIGQGHLAHEQIIRGELESDVIIRNTLIDMYARCGCLEVAYKLFGEFLNRDLVTWGTIMTGCVQNGGGLLGLELFEKMRQENIKPDVVIYSCILKACGSMKAIGQGRLIHDSVVKSGLEWDGIVGCALVGMYTKCDVLEEAHNVFDKLPEQDLVSWGTMIAGYAMHGLGRLALELSEKMKMKILIPGKATVLWILKACGSIGAIEQGRMQHSDMIKCGTESDVLIGNTLVDMYAKCGSLDDAYKVFSDLPTQNLVSWGAMISGSMLNGNCTIARKWVEDMQLQGFKPDDAIFTSILGACSHAGLVDQGISYFKSMKEDYDIMPNIEHYSCMVDLLGRAGCLNVAEDLIQTMPSTEDIIMWTSLLSSCRTYDDIELGRRCFEHAFRLDPSNASGYVLMENMCRRSDVGRC